jgi:hypothetical protein
MKAFSKKASAVLLIAVLAFGILAPALQAQVAAAGKFKLPFDAQWGRITMPTGDYTFVVEHASLGGKIAVYRDGQVIGRVLPQMFNDTETQSKNPVLVCLRHDGDVTIRALRLPGIGTFYFYLPKELKALAAQQPQLIETVSVQVNGN